MCLREKKNDNITVVQNNGTEIFQDLCQCKLLSVKTSQTCILVWDYRLKP